MATERNPLNQSGMETLWSGVALIGTAINIALPPGEERDDLYQRQAAIYSQITKCLGCPDPRSVDDLAQGFQDIAIDLDDDKNAILRRIDENG